MLFFVFIFQTIIHDNNIAITIPFNHNGHSFTFSFIYKRKFNALKIKYYKSLLTFSLKSFSVRAPTCLSTISPPLKNNNVGIFLIPN